MSFGGLTTSRSLSLQSMVLTADDNLSGGNVNGGTLAVRTILEIMASLLARKQRGTNLQACTKRMKMSRGSTVAKSSKDMFWPCTTLGRFLLGVVLSVPRTWFLNCARFEACCVRYSAVGLLLTRISISLTKDRFLHGLFAKLNVAQ